jgi:hypothetical protein
VPQQAMNPRLFAVYCKLKPLRSRQIATNIWVPTIGGFLVRFPLLIGIQNTTMRPLVIFLEWEVLERA